MPVSARGLQAGADLDALDGVDRHHRRGEVGAELAVDRRAPAGRHAFGHHLDHRADRVAVLADAVEIVGSHSRGRLGVGAEERVLVDLVPVEIGVVDLVRPHLHEAGADRDARRSPAAPPRRPRRAPRFRAPRRGREPL